jgi:hypothetical protein
MAFRRKERRIIMAYALCKKHLGQKASFTSPFIVEAIRNDNKLTFHTLFNGIFMNFHAFYGAIKVFGSTFNALRYSS